MISLSFALTCVVRFVRRVSVVFALSGALCIWASAAQATVMAVAPAQSSPQAAVGKGRLAGTIVGHMQAFLGIPYAAPPVGALRWQPPQPPASHSGLRQAIQFAPHCPQTKGFFGLPSTDEDCLYLNVFAPRGTKAGANLPVMVWIHGGAFVSGESDDYDPDRLVAGNTVVVTINYRLGYLGFLGTTGLDAERHPHINYGILDQQAALAWVHANIASFGGNSANTTTFGESAGGYSTLAQILSPGAAGLFQRAIVESGAYGILTIPTLQAAETAGNAIAKMAGCKATDTACLRALSVPQILALQPAGESLQALTSGPGPAIDGTVIPQSPETALLAGSYNHVPIVQGSNHDEFRLFTALIFDLQDGPMSSEEYPFVVGAVLQQAGLEAHTAEVLAKYPLANYASPDLAFSAFATDAAFSATTYITDSLLSVGTPLYAYEFSDEKAPEEFLPPVSFPYASCHASELQFLFDRFTQKAPPLFFPVEKQLARTMVGQWTQFAATGVPDAIGLPAWTPFVVPADDVESLVPPSPSLFFTFTREHKTLFWTKLLLASEMPLRANGARHYITLQKIAAAVATVRHHHP